MARRGVEGGRRCAALLGGLLAWLCATLLTWPDNPTRAASQANTVKLVAANGAASDFFGHAVALSGDTALVGAYGGDTGGQAEQGTAYLFTRNGAGWTLQQQLVAPDGAANDNFGWAVALSGDTALVGASGHGVNAQQGAAYVFTRAGTVWTLQQKLTAGDGVANDNFGWAVALSGDTALVGALGMVGANRNQGAAYVFTRTGTAWTQQQKLTASDGVAQAAFGSAVALEANTALIGAPDDDNNGQSLRGAAYVFVRNGAVWTQQQKLTANDGAAFDNFGLAVALSGTTALAGAPSAHLKRGAAYVFTRNGTAWAQQQKLAASDGAALDAFGASLTLSGERALIGAPGGNEAQGAAYTYLRGGATWTQLQKHTAGAGAANDSFGGALALSGNTALAGAAGSVIGANAEQGAAYVIELCPALSLGPDTFNITTVGAPITQPLTASGGAAPYSFALAGGALPDGLTLNGNGLLSGTPSRAGAFTFTVRALDANGCAGVRAWTLTITCNALTLAPVALPSGTAGAAYNQTLSATGGTAPYSFSLSAGGLPNGLTLAATGALSGTPTQAGDFNFTARAIDTNNCAGTRAYSLTLACPVITVNAPALPTGLLNRPYPAASFSASGGSMPYTFSLSAGALPAGLSLSNGGTLSGTPAQTGTFNFTATATDAAGCGGARAVSLQVRRTPTADFDGDGRSDLSVWRGATGSWLTLNSSNGALQTTQWGAGYAPYFDVIVPGDYDGDGRTDQAIWRGQDSLWYIKKSSDGQPLVRRWGANYAPYFDVPVPGDYDGDGQTDMAVWRPADGIWYVLKSSDGGVLAQAWGSQGDTPVPGDYDGDGKSDFAVWRPNDGNWLFKLSGGGTPTIQWGSGQAPYFDVPVAADYDGDGKTDPAIWRGQDSLWYIRQSSNAQPYVRLWGANYAPYFDVPVPGDYDGDGKADLAVWRPADALWYIIRSTTGAFLVQAHGQSGDVPVPAAGGR